MQLGKQHTIPLSPILKRTNTTVRTRTGGFLGLFIKWSWYGIILSAVLQCVFFGSAKNIFAVICVLVAWHITTSFVLTRSLLSRFTLSTFLIIGFSITQFYLPILFTLLEGKPLVYNLEVPYDVFTHSLSSFIVLILCHQGYVYVQKRKPNSKLKIQRMLARLHLYKQPSDRQIWVIGFIGLASMFFIHFIVKGSGNDGESGGGNAVIQGLVPFAYAPYFIPLSRMFGNKHADRKRIIYELLIYTVLLFIISIGRNSRGAFMMGFTSIGIGYFLGLLMGKFNYKIFTPRNFLLGLLVFYIITGPLSDLGTAMVVVRGQRGSVSSQQLIELTLEAYQDKDALRDYKNKASQSAISTDWDEHYFDNIFLARFCNLKFNDLCLRHAEQLEGVSPLMRQYSIQRFLIVFPQPILDFIGLEIDKSKILPYSSADYLLALSNQSYLRGGLRVGQFSGVGMASFGWWYLLILGLAMIPVYYLLDLFVRTVTITSPTRLRTYISLAGLLSITSIFMFLSLSSISTNVMNIFAYIIRGWIQMVLLYWMISACARLLTRFMK
ncbi:hypothetical protein [Parapedobacter tibetensis]|uniref:hypothetical protein n=1 Tax=Parapedobacter tibetensis TaxID=2972951 RepID=UPI00214D5B06|nr:hypothetical protein [Parapedobacter tibetensis]